MVQNFREDLDKTLTATHSGIRGLKTPRIPQSVPDHALGALNEYFQEFEEIGRGGTAWVYKALDIASQEIVAIKILAPMSAREERWQRFHREAEVLKLFDHPNIIRIRSYGVVWTDEKEKIGFPFLIMDFVEAPDLLQFVNRYGPMQFDQAVSVLTPLCDVLRICHSENIVHRDFKSANILYNQVDNAIKVIDFGLAHTASLTEKLPLPDNNQTPTIAGTPVFMAPEQLIDADQELTTAVDVWGFGMTTLFLLTGTMPFKVRSVDQLKSAIGKFEPTDFLKSRPDIPEQLNKLCRACLSVDPKQRPNADELWHVFNGLAKGCCLRDNT